MFRCESRGKLLLTGEYLVLDGALALSVPTRFQQSMQVISQNDVAQIEWLSHDPSGLWFHGHFELADLDFILV
ncbi:MAG: GHMP kinase, partial [Bacteroidota bacterium]